MKIDLRYRALKKLDSIHKKPLSKEERTQEAIELAEIFLELAKSQSSKADREYARFMNSMLEDERGKAFLASLTDQSFRSEDPKKSASSISYLIKKFGIPKFLPINKRMGFLLFLFLGEKFPKFFVWALKKKLRKEVSELLLPFNKKKLAIYVRSLKKENVLINLNHLGEEILGEKEAAERLEIYLQALEEPWVDQLSVKISTLYSQINPIAFEHSRNALADKLRLLLRQSQKLKKVINLDMEEYKDLELTVALFKKVLQENEFVNLTAGIALQSYLPDSYEALVELANFSKMRVENGGSAIKIRLVKGANMAMENVISSLHHWPKPTFQIKTHTDANFKKMLDFACDVAAEKKLFIGIASHNLFDLSYALVRRSENSLQGFMQIEMLQKMSEPIRKAIQLVTKDLLLYCPRAEENHFYNALAYLVRRLEENSGPDNFLRDLFAIQENEKLFEKQKRLFLESLSYKGEISEEKEETEGVFLNEPDTNFSLKENRRWAAAILENCRQENPSPIPLVIQGKEIYNPLLKESDPSYRYSKAGKELIDQALFCSKKFQKSWEDTNFFEKARILKKCAKNFRRMRGDLLSTMVIEGGKTLSEADPEISEAVDFIEYYLESYESFLSMEGVCFSPKGSILVAPPWNFSCSIPTGAIAASLIAGNSVLFKPAPEAILTGWKLVNLFWQAGVPKEVLQFIHCDEEPEGSYLIAHPLLDAVLLTGSTLTAKYFLHLKPGIDLNAETGGKNAVIVTAHADRDQAVKNIIRSAFSYNGQKCSACSLAILEAEVYDDPHFLDQLKDAAASLPVETVISPHAFITPLIHPPKDPLKKALSTLEPKEKWLLKPKAKENNPHLWSPGIKVGVQQGSFTHQTEFFGPLLGVMRAKDLLEGIEFANSTPYGLTSGLFSLDEREQDIWKKRIQAGNLYINRGITGAIVNRQPFGGRKQSSFGIGAKAGGPNYMLQVCRVNETAPEIKRGKLPVECLLILSHIGNFKLSQEELQTLKKSMENYAYWAPILKKPEDRAQILGQDNYFYYVPRETVYVRSIDWNALAILQICAACFILGVSKIQISLKNLPNALKVLNGLEIFEEEDEAFFQRVQNAQIRIVGNPDSLFLKKAAESFCYLSREKILQNGRIELLHYMHEVSLSVDYHRYGYIPRYS